MWRCRRAAARFASQRRDLDLHVTRSRSAINRLSDFMFLPPLHLCAAIPLESRGTEQSFINANQSLKSHLYISKVYMLNCFVKKGGGEKMVLPRDSGKDKSQRLKAEQMDCVRR